MNLWDIFERELAGVPRAEDFLEYHPVNLTMTVGAFELSPVPEWALQEEAQVAKTFSLDVYVHPFGGRFAYGTTVHHLYHLLRFESATGIDPFSLKRIHEFGGGYGNIARIFSLLNPTVSYSIHDLPAVAALQEWYLTETGCGGDWIDWRDITGPVDLYISTWGLSEAPRSLIEEEFELLDARHGLLAWQVKDEFPDSTIFDTLARERCMTVEKTLSNGSYYGFW
jgi:hypothetical protein